MAINKKDPEVVALVAAASDKAKAATTKDAVKTVKAQLKQRLDGEADKAIKGALKGFVDTVVTNLTAGAQA